MVFGGVGAIIGGLSGSTREEGIIKKLIVRVFVDDAVSPFHDIALLEPWAKINPNNHIAKLAIESADRFNALLVTAMRRAADKKTNNTPKLAEHHSFISDEIRKLSDLQKGGVLTEFEFQQQKAKLLKVYGGPKECDG